MAPSPKESPDLGSKRSSSDGKVPAASTVAAVAKRSKSDGDSPSQKGAAGEGLLTDVPSDAEERTQALHEPGEGSRPIEGVAAEQEPVADVSIKRSREEAIGLAGTEEVSGAEAEEQNHQKRRFRVAKRSSLPGTEPPISVDEREVNVQSKLARFSEENSANGTKLLLLLDDQSSTIYGQAGSKACVSIAVQTISWFVKEPTALAEIRQRNAVGELLKLEADITTNCIERGIEKHLELPSFIKKKDHSVLNSEAIIYAELRLDAFFSSEPICGQFNRPQSIRSVCDTAWELCVGEAALFLYEHTKGVGHALALLKNKDEEIVIFDSAANTPEGTRAMLRICTTAAALFTQLEMHLSDCLSTDLHWQVFFVDKRGSSQPEASIEQLKGQLEWWRDNSKEWVKRAAGMCTRLRDLEGQLAESEQASKELAMQKEAVTHQRDEALKLLARHKQAADGSGAGSPETRMTRSKSMP